MMPEINWERGIAPPETHACGPVRIIPVTAAMRAEDERKRLERERAPAAAWAIRSELSVENLRKSAPAKRVAHDRPKRAKVVHSRNQQSRALSKPVAQAIPDVPESVQEDIVVFSLEVTTPEPQLVPEGVDPLTCLHATVRELSPTTSRCDACLSVIYHDELQSAASDAPEFSETWHTVMAWLDEGTAAAVPADQVSHAGTTDRCETPAKRVCSKCRRRTLKATNTGELCAPCKSNQKVHEQYLAHRKACVASCGRYQRNGTQQRPDGLCGPCGTRHDRKTRREAAQAQKPVRICLVCDEAVPRKSKGDYCVKHAWASRFHVTELKAGSIDEWRADLLWQQLSAADKWALLEIAGGR